MAGLAAIVLVAAAVATATTRQKGGVVAAGTTTTFVAKCPKGERVDVGGFKSTVNTPSGILVEDLTFKGGRRWRGAFDGLGDSAPATVFAYCGDTPRLVKRTQSTTATPLRVGRGAGGDLRMEATAKCPRGSTVQLGGFTTSDNVAAPGEHDVNVDSMRRVTPRKWRVTAAGEVNSVLTAVAGCADLPAPSKVTESASLDGDGATAVKARCPRGKQVVMGGFRQAEWDGGPYISALKRGSPRVWKAVTWESSETGTLTAIAYCG